MRGAHLCKLVFAGALVLLPAVATADVVTEWNQRADESVLEAKLFPFAGTRVMAIMHTAMFDAINSIEGRYTPYKFTVSAAPACSAEAAGVASAHATLVKLFPEQKAALDASLATSLARIPDGAGKAGGIAVGEEVAAKVLAWRNADGAEVPNVFPDHGVLLVEVESTIWVEG